MWLFKGLSSAASSMVPIDTTMFLQFYCHDVPRTGDHVSMARGVDGRVHVLYMDEAANVRYAVSNTAATAFGTPVTLGSGVLSAASNATAIATDASDRPHVLFSNPDGPIYGYLDTAGWQLAPVSLPAYSGGFGGITSNGVALVLGSDGLAHVVLGLSDKMWYARESSALSFTEQTELQQSASWAFGPSIALQSTGARHVSFYEDVGSNLFTRVRYAVNSGSGWTAEVLPTFSGGPTNGERTSIVVTSGATGQPRIGYKAPFDEGGEGAWFAWRDATEGWSTEPAIPCSEGGGSGGSGGGEHDPYEEGAATYELPLEEDPRSFTMRGPSVVSGASALELQLSSGMATGLRIEIMDIAGRRVETRRVTLSRGSNTVRWQPTLQPGVYMVRASTTGGAERTLRLTVLH